jgi:integrase
MPQQTLMILRSLTDPLYFALVFTVAATALRASEVIALRWADIMWDESLIRINKRWRKGKDGNPKTEASDSTVALGPILAHYLREDEVDVSRVRTRSLPCASASL